MEEKTPDSERVYVYEYEKFLQNQRHAERAHDKLDNFIERSSDAAIKSGKLALRTVTLINGGAVIAVLGFISAVASKDSERSAQIVPVAKSLLWFSGGVAMASVAAGFAFLANYAATSGAGHQRRTWNHPYVEKTAGSKKWHRYAVAFQ